MSAQNSQPWPPQDAEIKAALDAVWQDGSWGKYHGRYVAQLEQALCQFHQLSAARACASGTVAVELGLVALGVQPGDEVILAAYDFPGNFRCIEQVGAKPVLVDIDPATGCLDASQLADAHGSRTVAVIVSHLHGGLADMRRICEWARQCHVAVLEDTCQAPGAIVDGRLAGTWGDVATLSFGGSKLLTAGRGGAVLTDRAECLQRMKVYAERGNDAYPLSELQAAVLIPQLSRLKERNAQRAHAAKRLRIELQRIRGVRWVGAPVRTDHRPAYYKVGLLVDEGRSRAEWMAVARDRGVYVAAGFPGFSRRSDRRCRKVGQLPCALEFSERLALLHHPALLRGHDDIVELARQLQS